MPRAVRTPATSPAAARKAALGAAILLSLAAAVWSVQTIRRAERSSGNDLIGYLAASEALYTGGDPYRVPGRFPYIYPLFLATVARPLAWLGVRGASVAWFLIEWACLLYVLWPVTLRLGRYAVRGLAAAALTVAVFGDVLQIEFLNGQVNLIVLALVVGALRLADSRPGVAPLLLGAAIALKLTPALLLVCWIADRRYAAAARAVAWAGALILLPWLVVQDRLWPLYRAYVHDFIVARATSADPHGGAMFFSPSGFWGWVTGAAPGRAVVAGSAAAIVGGLVLWHTRARARRPGAPVAPFAWVYLAATPLVSPMSEVHHLTAAIPAFGAAAQPAASLARLLLGAFAVLLWLGRLDRQGPWYFLSVVCIVIAAALAAAPTAEQT